MTPPDTSPIVIVVTGASQGIGAAIAAEFAAHYADRARLALVARNEERLGESVRACQSLGATARAYRCDVTDAAAVDAMAAAVVADFGAPAVLVNNAGAFVPGRVEETTPEEFREMLEANLTSAFLVTRAFLPHLRTRPRADVLFMASVASTRGYPDGVAYCAAKHGLLGLARSLREETKGGGVRVVTLLPGATLTHSWSGTDLPEERFMPAEDVARMVVEFHRLSERTVVEEVVLRPQLGDV